MRRGIAIGLLGLLLAAPPRPAAAEEEGKPAPAAEPAPLPAARFVGPRLPGKERDEAFKRGGGTSEAAKAIEGGLDWLLRHADPGGGWDADGFPDRCEAKGKRCEGIGRGHHGEEAPCPFDGAISALGAMALLGHGVLPDAEGDARAAHLERTLRRLEGTRDPWTLALATEAFAEAEATERKGRWRDAATAGAKALLAARGEDGAWGYAAGFRKGSDVPYSGLVGPALVAARDAGVDLPSDLGKGVDRFLESLEVDDGKLAYLLDGRKYGYTPTGYNAHAAAALREVLRCGLDEARHRAHLDFLRARRPAWVVAARDVTLVGQPKRRVTMGKFDLLEWWSGGVAMFQRGGVDGSAWYGAAKSALVPHQRDDGCARGSWDPVGLYERNVGGRVLATALGVLILEEPVRHRRL
jgi:hypothetical protein